MLCVEERLFVGLSVTSKRLLSLAHEIFFVHLIELLLDQLLLSLIYLCHFHGRFELRERYILLFFNLGSSGL